MASNHIIRGILIGGSLGVFASLLGMVEMGRGAAWGMLAGFFAGLTLARREQQRADKAKKSMQSKDNE